MQFIFSAIKKSLYSVVILFVILAGFAAFLVSSTPGLFLTMKLVNKFLPGNLDVIAIQGQVANHVSLKQLTYTDKNLQLKITNLDLHWRLRDLFWHKLTIENIQVERVELITSTSPDQKNPATTTTLSGFPKLPVDIIINNVQIHKLDVTANGAAVPLQSLALQARLTNHQWEIPHLGITFNHHDITLKTRADATFPYKADASLQIKNLKKNMPGLDGQLTFNGNFHNYLWTGKLKQPTALVLQGNLKNGQELHSRANWQQFKWPIDKNRIFRLEKGQFQIDGPSLSTLKMTAGSEQSLPFEATLSMKANTTPDAINASAALTSKHGSLQINVARANSPLSPVSGDFNAKIPGDDTISPLLRNTSIQGQFKGSSLENMSLSSKINALYQTTPLNASLNYQQQTLHADINLNSNRLKLEGKLATPWKFTATLPNPELLHPGFAGLKTKISAEGVLSSPQQGSLIIKINQGTYDIPDTLNLPFEGGELRATLDKKQLQASGKFILDSNKTLSLNVKLPDFRYETPYNTKQKIIGNVRLAINSLAFLNTLSPEISNAQGQLNADLNMAGTIGKPLLTGKLNLANASIALPKMGINLNPVQLTLQSKDKKWDAKGKIVSSNSALAIQGQGELFPAFNGKLSLNAIDFPIINTSEYMINLSPKMDLEIAPSLLKINGTILVPKAQIKPQTFTDTVSVSDDVVFVTDAPPSPNPFNLNTNVSITMGNEVALDIKGLHGFLTGGINLQQLPGHQLTANGELNIRDGKYTAYGQDLTIEQGQLLFTGGQIENPGIRVRAVRKFKNATNSFAGSNQIFDFKSDNVQTLDLGNKTTTGIEVSGRLTEPKIKLFSVPSNLSQADILSLLLLGKPASQASESGGQLLLTAVSALNLGSGAGGTQLLEQLKHNLGIDFNLQNNPQYNQKTNQSTNSTAFVVGKSLSKRLYLSYNMGLSNSDNNMLTLKYLLNKFLSIQVNASTTASGIDLLYTHKKD